MIARSLPKIVDGYDNKGSKILKSLAWIPKRFRIEYLSKSKILLSPSELNNTQLQETKVMFFKDILDLISIK